MKNILKQYKEKIFVVLGFLSLLLGIIGAIMPVMPTVPFLFIAYFCFKRGSKRFSNWYEKSKFHSQYKKSVQGFFSMPISRRILYLLGMGLFFSCLFYFWYYIYVNYFDIVLEYLKSRIA